VSARLGQLGLVERIVHTGQHYDAEMSGAFFAELGIPAPRHNLGIGSGSHGRQTGAMLTGVEDLLLDDRPDVVLVYGDTNSTLAGALAAVKLHIPVAHVEAGLRSFNRRMPEEVNRVLADHVSSLLFAPTEAAVSNLRAEGVAGPRVLLVGDVMYDLALMTARRIGDVSAAVAPFGVEPDAFVLATVHRAENTDDPARLAAILGGLAATTEHLPVVLPLHPRTRRLAEAAGGDHLGRITVTAPLGYGEMAALEMAASVVATDSGGVQKEAFFHRTPCVTLRDETEWVELVELGWNRVVAPTSAAVVAAAIIAAAGTRGRDAEPYGAGDAGSRIAAALAAGVQR
jgi:UDP-GlcNAc3NAcA epimerase